MSDRRPFSLFEAVGVELEYMIVSADTLNVQAITDQVMLDVAGEYLSEIERGTISWSNELALHVIELKTTEPAASPAGLAAAFQQNVVDINALLAPHGARLMPTAMHPWMNPEREMKLWPHDYSPVYETFDRIFNCRGHGWANLQSAHLNLPFADDDEFGALHAAIRLLLPLIPALAASSPIVDGAVTGLLDSRLDVYRHNARRVPIVSGQVVPEPAFTAAAYQSEILDRIYADLAPHDPEGVLRFEWANSRGAIARFDRNAIEIRVVDVQECPAADLAIVQAEIAVLRGLVEGRFASISQQQAMSTADLHRVLLATIHSGEEATIDDPAYLAIWGLNPSEPVLASQLWRYLLTEVSPWLEGADEPTRAALNVILDQGPLARRILRSAGNSPSEADLAGIYRQLCDCLAKGVMFTPGG